MLFRGGIFLSPLLGRDEAPFSNRLKAASPALRGQLLRGGTPQVLGELNAGSLVYPIGRQGRIL